MKTEINFEEEHLRKGNLSENTEQCLIYVWKTFL